MSNLSDQPIRSDASCLFWDRSPGSVHVCYDLPAPAPGLDAGPGQSVPFNMGLAGIFRTGNKKLALVFSRSRSCASCGGHSLDRDRSDLIFDAGRLDFSVRDRGGGSFFLAFSP